MPFSIEVEGGQHNFDAHALEDRKRDVHFEREGFTVLRFWNNEVGKKLGGVLDVIDQHFAVQQPPPGPPSAGHPPPAGEG